MPGITTKYDYAHNIVSLVRTAYNTKYREYEIIRPHTIYVTSFYIVYTAVRVNKKFNGKIVTSYKIPTNIRQFVSIAKKDKYGKPITRFKGIVAKPSATVTTKGSPNITSVPSSKEEQIRRTFQNPHRIYRVQPHKEYTMA